jgi:hypothetical protein
MVRRYYAQTVIGNRSTGASLDTYIQIAVPANVNCRVMRVHFADGDGTSTTVIAEASIRIQLLETSTTMAGTSSSFTPIKRDPNGPDASCTVLVRDTSTVDNTAGTEVRRFLQIIMRNDIGEWEYVARDPEDALTLLGSASTFFCVVISKNGTAVRQKTVSVVWEEF